MESNSYESENWDIDFEHLFSQIYLWLLLEKVESGTVLISDLGYVLARLLVQEFCYSDLLFYFSSVIEQLKTWNI